MSNTNTEFRISAAYLKRLRKRVRETKTVKLSWTDVGDVESVVDLIGNFPVPSDENDRNLLHRFLLVVSICNIG